MSRSTEGIFLARPDPVGDGIRLAVKDLFDTAGLVTTYGSILFADHVPGETAAAVRLLEDAGYANVGKANLHEFAYGVTSENPHFGTVPNPLAAGRTAGGSSGGSAAALAAGLAEAALGSDSAGSIRIPAACCGVVGFKPSFGLVSLEGCFPLAPSFDHAGPLARRVEGCASMMAALAPGLAPAGLRSLGELEVGVAWLEHAEPLVRARVEQAVSRFPHRRMVELELPDRQDWGPLFQREAIEVHSGLFPEHADEYGADVREQLERGLAVTDADFERAQRIRERHGEQVPEALEGLDLLVTPTLPSVAPALGEGERATLTRFTSLWNLLGWPALALPCGAAERGLPASVQLVGPRGQDAVVLAAAALLEAALSSA